MGAHALFISFVDIFDTEHRQYRLYNFAGILSAVGGACGLFLGISFFSVFEKLIRNMSKKIC